MATWSCTHLPEGHLDLAHVQQVLARAAQGAREGHGLGAVTVVRGRAHRFHDPGSLHVRLGIQRNRHGQRVGLSSVRGSSGSGGWAMPLLPRSFHSASVRSRHPMTQTILGKDGMTKTSMAPPVTVPITTNAAKGGFPVAVLRALGHVPAEPGCRGRQAAPCSGWPLPIHGAGPAPFPRPVLISASATIEPVDTSAPATSAGAPSVHPVLPSVSSAGCSSIPRPVRSSLGASQVNHALNQHAAAVNDTGPIPALAGRTCDFVIRIVLLGSIPALAGKSDRLRSRVALRQAHPRACGANLGSMGSRSPNWQAHPRLRGAITRSHTVPLLSGAPAWRQSLSVGGGSAPRTQVQSATTSWMPASGNTGFDFHGW